MGYQALLFCPDDKTARTVTQVLSELEFNVESCTEPFAAVKKLMGQHFDAVVVDCDNEQNATLLFKSARNSASNQASLAVAVVEGQAGVAKAFRIGANLVLTKPINIEQAKGTLRVARGLLRKGEPAKPGAPATASSAAAPVPAKSGPAVQGAKPEVQTASAAISTTFARTKTDATPSWPAPAAAAASANATAQDDDLLDIGGEDTAPKPEAAGKPAIRFITPSSDPDKFLAAALVSTEPNLRAPSNPLPATLSGGAASAPAPARERQEPRVAEVSPERPTEVEARAKNVEAVQSESRSLAGSAPTFTFGGANAPAESSASSKKIFLGIAAAAIIAVAAYAGRAHFKGRPSEPESTQTETTSALVATPQTPKPSGSKPSATPVAPKSPTSLPSSQTTGQPAKAHAPDELDSALDDADSSRPSTSGEAAEAATPPLVVKAGKVPAVHTKPGAADTPAPSMLEIATAGESAPPPDLGGGSEIMPKPLPQALNISQGVSHGLLTKKVQPVYPKNALAMRVEGSVELMATISKTGDITHVKVLNGDSQLAKAAAEAVKQWKYKPYLLNGEPVDIQTQIRINFKLPK